MASRLYSPQLSSVAHCPPQISPCRPLPSPNLACPPPLFRCVTRPEGALGPFRALADPAKAGAEKGDQWPWAKPHPLKRCWPGGLVDTNLVNSQTRWMSRKWTRQVSANTECRPSYLRMSRGPKPESPSSLWLTGVLDGSVCPKIDRNQCQVFDRKPVQGEIGQILDKRQEGGRMGPWILSATLRGASPIMPIAAAKRALLSPRVW